MTNKLHNDIPIPFKSLVITSLIGGFLLIPVHEFGHVIAHWISGTPAAMSYARDYLIVDAEKTWLGHFGGPFLPLLLSSLSVLCLFVMENPPAVLFPVAVLGTLDRLVLYVTGSLPSDERTLAELAGLPEGFFRNLFMTIEILLIAFVIIRLRFMKKSLIQILMVLAVPVVSFIVMALFGIFVVEKNIFPDQFMIQFG